MTPHDDDMKKLQNKDRKDLKKNQKKIATSRSQKEKQKILKPT